MSSRDKGNRLICLRDKINGLFSLCGCREALLWEARLTCGNGGRYNLEPMFLILSLMMLAQSEDIKNLRDVNPTIRKNAISTLAEKDAKEAIRPIIDLLARERDESVLNAAADALERLS